MKQLVEGRLAAIHAARRRGGLLSADGSGRGRHVDSLGSSSCVVIACAAMPPKLVCRLYTQPFILPARARLGQ